MKSPSPPFRAPAGGGRGERGSALFDSTRDVLQSLRYASARVVGCTWPDRRGAPAEPMSRVLLRLAEIHPS